MKKVKFSVMCNAVYYGEIEVEDNADDDEILWEARNSINDIPVKDLEWIGDLDLETAITMEDILYVGENVNGER